MMYRCRRQLFFLASVEAASKLASSWCGKPPDLRIEFKLRQE